eukprot:429135-Rhodomonas_salina.1
MEEAASMGGDSAHGSGSMLGSEAEEAAAAAEEEEAEEGVAPVDGILQQLAESSTDTMSEPEPEPEEEAEEGGVVGE